MLLCSVGHSVAADVACSDRDANWTWEDWGYSAYAAGLQEPWAPFDFVEQFHAQHNDRVIADLNQRLAAAYRNVNASQRNDTSWRQQTWKQIGQASSEAFDDIGLFVFSSNLPSTVNNEEPSGPRFYISVDTAWKRIHGAAVTPMPHGLRSRLWPAASEAAEAAADGAAAGEALKEAPECRAGVRAAAFMHNMGWVLVPPGSDPQGWHYDWHGVQGMRHLMWTSESTGPAVTTQSPLDEDDACSVSADDGTHGGAAAKVVVWDSGRFLHRGAGTHGLYHWTSTLSMEFTNVRGHRNWMRQHANLAAEPVWARTCVLADGPWEESSSEACDSALAAAPGDSDPAAGGSAGGGAALDPGS